mmetsp:Transcript_61033/g.172029  ORF Transcript_61033/g.172029 Transcript_61033/m.172029 type:complete len:250 (+) Transcript_61033:804-1553(+)
MTSSTSSWRCCFWSRTICLNRGITLSVKCSSTIFLLSSYEYEVWFKTATATDSPDINHAIGPPKISDIMNPLRYLAPKPHTFTNPNASRLVVQLPWLNMVESMEPPCRRTALSSSRNVSKISMHGFPAWMWGITWHCKAGLVLIDSVCPSLYTDTNILFIGIFCLSKSRGAVTAQWSSRHFKRWRNSSSVLIIIFTVFPKFARCPPGNSSHSQRYVRSAASRTATVRSSSSSFSSLCSSCCIFDISRCT